MKNIGKLAVLGAVLAASTSFAFGDTITLGSFGAAGLAAYHPTVTVSNSEMQYAGNQIVATVALIPATPTISSIAPVNATDLNPSAVWFGPVTNSSWVGINDKAGPMSTSNPGFGYYEFTTTFTAVGGLYSGNLDVMADDTMEVLLNNVLIPSLSFGALGGDLHCADGMPTCLVEDNLAIGSISLLTGTNTLTFIVKQAGTGPVGGTSDPSGMDFNGSLVQSTVPEPNSLMLLGTGLVSAAGMLLRRRRVTA
jgi:hypothetical protein